MAPGIGTDPIVLPVALMLPDVTQYWQAWFVSGPFPPLELFFNLWPLPLTLLGFSFLFGAVVLMRIRAELARTKAEARLRRRAGE